MSVIGHQSPGVAGRPGFRQDICQPLEKLIAIVVVAEDRAPLDSSDNDVVKRTGGIYACFTWHAGFLAIPVFNVKLIYKFMYVPFILSS
jgi:hypothetical protein